MTDFPEFNPTVDQTLQVEEPEKVPPIPVTVTDPAQVRVLPAKTASFDSYDLTQVAVKILGRDPRRKRAIISTDPVTFIRLGATQAQAMSAGATVIGNFELTTLDEVWAYTTKDTTIGVITEIWAD